MDVSETVAIVGCGFIGSALGARLSGDARVLGTTTTPGRVGELRTLGIEGHVLELVSVECLGQVVADAATVYLTVAPGKSGRPLREVYLEGARHLLEALRGSRVESLVYTSSSAVYGQDDGSWVDESSSTEPGTDAGAVLLETERTLVEGAADLGVALAIVRLCGIHGPDRGPGRVALRRAGTVRTDGESYLNLVHRDDIVEALALLYGRRHDGILNLNDDHPTTRREYYDRVLIAAGLAPISWQKSSTPPGGGHGRRVRNTLIKKTLGLALKHPRH